ncbi:MAG TPA: UDP-glucose 4-epimerase GalE [Terriglobia bacterium]|nr:UDP-glucose 4-epimerase GalE [Terriglobia bacterium]
MKILVTGGAGYIGSHTAKALARKGFEPVTLDDLSAGQREAVRWGELVEGDFGSREILRGIFVRHKIEAVFHFAASASVGESVRDPRSFYHNNVTNTLTLLDAMLDAGVKTMIFSSSAATYGNPEKVPMPEDHRQLPINPYGETKLAIEQALRWYGAAYGLRWVAFRYFNAAGADPEGEIGERHNPEEHLIPRVIQAVLGAIPEVQIYGTDYPTQDGTAVRDYIHVSDLADAHVLGLEYLQKGGESATFNLGTSTGHSVRKVIEMVEKVSRKRVPFSEAPRRAGDPPALVADGSKAMRAFGWQPQHPDLETIVKTAWRWHAVSSRSAAPQR